MDATGRMEGRKAGGGEEEDGWIKEDRRRWWERWRRK